MAVTMREAWTDERLDDLSARVEAGFAQTHVDITELRREVRQGDEALRAEIGTLRAEMGDALRSEAGTLRSEIGTALRTEIGTLRTETGDALRAETGTLRTEMGALRTEMNSRFAAVELRMDKLETRLDRMTLMILGTLIAGFAGLFLGHLG